MRCLVHVIDSLGVGGAEKLLKSTLDSLPEYEHVVCYLHQPADLAPLLNCSNVYCLHAKDYKGSLMAALRLRRIITRHKPFAVHSHLLLSTWIARLATWKRCPLFFSIHSMLSQDAFTINRKSLMVEKLTYKQGQTVITVSEEVLKDYSGWVGIKGRSFVLPNFVPDEFFLKRPLSTNGISDTKLVAVGNLKALKNYDCLLDAMRILKEAPVSLSIYGDGPLKDHLIERIRSEELNVHLLGIAPNMENLLPQYDLYIMPSLHEGYGLAAIEAMAVGLPVLLSDLEVFKETAGSFPIYFNQKDSVSIASAIQWAIENREEAQAKAAAGKQAILLKASKKIYMERLNQIYKTAFSVSRG